MSFEHSVAKFDYLIFDIEITEQSYMFWESNTYVYGENAMVWLRNYPCPIYAQSCALSNAAAHEFEGGRWTLCTAMSGE